MPNTFIFLIWKFVLILIGIFSIFIFILIHATKKRCSDDSETQFLKKLIKHIFCLFIIIIIGALFSSLSLISYWYSKYIEKNQIIQMIHPLLFKSFNKR